MATIQFKALGKKDPVNLNVRFFHNQINCYAKSNIFINSKNWSEATGKVKGLPQNEKRPIEDKINNLSDYIFAKFSQDFPVGNRIDSDWLIRLVNEFHKRPEGEKDYRYFFTPFVEKYIIDSKTRINPSSGNLISPLTIKNYNTTLKRLKQYEEINGPLRTKNVDLDFHNRFTRFLKVVGKYSNTLISKYIDQIKNFVKEAKVCGFETSPEIDSKQFTFRRDETIDTYLTEAEINRIFEMDLRDNARLDKVRDLLILGVWTGLRISDIKRINDFNISENRIKIIGTEKNNASVEIPIHPQLKAILHKRNSIFPQISEQKFNQYVKELCEKAEITEITLGSIKDKTNRKVRGYYPKYKLISSHTCRRSFVSVHHGKLPDATIMAITTHKSPTQYMRYIKTTCNEHASNLEEYWNVKELAKGQTEA